MHWGWLGKQYRAFARALEAEGVRTGEVVVAGAEERSSASLPQALLPPPTPATPSPARTAAPLVVCVVVLTLAGR